MRPPCKKTPASASSGHGATLPASGKATGSARNRISAAPPARRLTGMAGSAGKAGKPRHSSARPVRAQLLRHAPHRLRDHGDRGEDWPLHRGRQQREGEHCER